MENASTAAPRVDRGKESLCLEGRKPVKLSPFGSCTFFPPKNKITYDENFHGGGGGSGRKIMGLIKLSLFCIGMTFV